MTTKSQKINKAIVLIEKIWSSYMAESLVIANGNEVTTVNYDGSSINAVIALNLQPVKMTRNGTKFSASGSVITEKDETGTYISVMNLNSNLSVFEMTATIAHELRHIWQEMNGWQFSEQSELSFFQCVDLPEEIDARNFEKKVISDLGLDVSKLSSGGKFWYKGE